MERVCSQYWNQCSGLKRAMPLLVLLVWAVLVGVSLYFNIRHTLELEHKMALGQAEAVVEYNTISRLWNAQRGGPYAPIDEMTQPNPYLDVPHRDFIAPHGVEMTTINPAYMSRQMSEIASARGALTFRLTSLDLLNPGNAPTPLERTVLQGFERGEPAMDVLLSDEQGRRLFYMSEFKVEDPCLKCHRHQGYEVGDVRGGISVEVPLADSPNVAGPMMTHVALFLGGGVFLGFAALRTRASFDELSSEATIDELTGLPNRRSLMRQFKADFARSCRHGHPLSVLVIDIDDFKLYNDHFGHQSGDDCLKRVAGALDATMQRPGELVARYGGEEFVVLLPHIDLTAALQAAEMLRIAVERTGIEAPPGGAAPVLTISIGAAELRQGDERPVALFERADQALYQAKKSGKNQVAFATEP